MCGDILKLVDTQMQCEGQYGNFVASCNDTVSDAEACIHAKAADPCSDGGDTCQALFACGAGAAAFADRPDRPR